MGPWAKKTTYWALYMMRFKPSAWETWIIKTFNQTHPHDSLRDSHCYKLCTTLKRHDLRNLRSITFHVCLFPSTIVIEKTLTPYHSRYRYCDFQSSTSGMLFCFWTSWYLFVQWWIVWSSGELARTIICPRTTIKAVRAVLVKMDILRDVITVRILWSVMIWSCSCAIMILLTWWIRTDGIPGMTWISRYTVR